MMTRHCCRGAVCTFVGGAIVAGAIILRAIPAQYAAPLAVAPSLKVAIAVTVGKGPLTEFQQY